MAEKALVQDQQQIISYLPIWQVQLVLRVDPEMIKNGNGLVPPGGGALADSTVAAFSPGDGITVLRGNDIYGGVNTWKGYYCVGFRNQGSPANTKTDAEIDQ